jgi:hypothetical protein
MTETQVMTPSVDKLVEYCSGIALEFEARLNRIRTFIPDHNLTSGTANEIILRNFLSRLAAGRYEVDQGFICAPTASNLVSKQCDILVYDHYSYPLAYSEGEVKLVFPESVRMLIEVKTVIDEEKLGTALANVCVAKRIPPNNINGVVFAFKGPRPTTIIKHLQQYSGRLSMAHAPIAILILDRNVIIHRWFDVTAIQIGGTADAYEVRQSNEPGVVMAFLLLLFFSIQMLEVWGSAEIMRAVRALLESKTSILAKNINIGG